MMNLVITSQALKIYFRLIYFKLILKACLALKLLTILFDLAMKHYDGVPLDGRVMKIEMASSDLNGAVVQRARTRWVTLDISAEN